MKENSIVRENLMAMEGYSPYCGNFTNCKFNNPRALWSAQKEQFVCACGWESKFPKDFIERYKAKWNK